MSRAEVTGQARWAKSSTEQRRGSGFTRTADKAAPHSSRGRKPRHAPGGRDPTGGIAPTGPSELTRPGSNEMSDFKPGLEGVIAFETEIAEPDKEGGALRYRGVNIEDLIGHVSFGNVWGLLVDGAFRPGLPPAEP